MTQRYHADSRSRSRSRSSSRSSMKSADSRSSNFSDRRSYKRARSPRRENPRPAACLGIFNLHPMATERDLQDVFGVERYGEIRDIKVIRDHDTGKSKCYGFVYYVNVKDAILAKEELNNTEMRHKIIRVDYSYSKEKGGSGGAPRHIERQRSPPRSDYFRDRPRNRSRSPPAHSHPSRRNARYSRSMSPRPAYRSRNRSPSPNVPPRNYRAAESSFSGNRSRKFDSEIQPNKCIGIFNLNRSTTEDKLRSVFKRFGSIESVRIVTDHDTNESKGFGFVYFTNERSAIESCEKMNQQEIHGNIVRVDFSKSNARRENSYNQRGRRSVSYSPERSRRH